MRHPRRQYQTGFAAIYVPACGRSKKYQVTVELGRGGAFPISFALMIGFGYSGVLASKIILKNLRGAWFLLS
jgi:hypothetical protein